MPHSCSQHQGHARDVLMAMVCNTDHAPPMVFHLQEGGSLAVAMPHGCSQHQGHTRDVLMTMVCNTDHVPPMVFHHGYNQTLAKPVVSERAQCGYNQSLGTCAPLFLKPRLLGCTLQLVDPVIKQNVQRPCPARDAYTWTWSPCT